MVLDVTFTNNVHIKINVSEQPEKLTSSILLVQSTLSKWCLLRSSLEGYLWIRFLGRKLIKDDKTLKWDWIETMLKSCF